MATASGKTEGTNRSAMPYVAYGVVLALLFVAGFAVWTMGRVVPGLSVPPAPSTDTARTARALKLPPRPPESEPAAAPVRQEPTPSTPPQAVVGEQKPEPSKPDPSKSECKVEFNRWPADRTDQAQAVQVLLRHLGYYRGTTNGTVGPQTRTAIREFQLASGDAETGEVTEVLFEALKKKCAASAN
jgi:Na+-transporting methylmalonyl-CoA/oxaloacetate decarboxylase gamma subunit